MWIEQLLPKQRPAFEYMLNSLLKNGGAALFAEQGVGKTHISLALIEELKPETLLIITPLSGIETTWSSRLSLFKDYTVYHHDELAEFKKDIGPRIMLMHFQMFYRLIKKLKTINWDMVLIDESQGLKARNSKQSRASRQLRHAPLRLILSGTPIDKTPIDVWAQMRFVDHTVLGENWQTFADQWCYQTGYKGKVWAFKMQLLPKFLDQLGSYIYRLTADDLDIPKAKVHLIHTQLLGEQGRVYRQMEETFLASTNDYIIKADLELTKQIKLAQIAGGFIYDEETVWPVGKAKLRKLSALLSKLKPPIVISCRFLPEIQLILPMLRKRFIHVRTLTAAVKDTKLVKHRSKLITDFQSGKIDALVLQVRTGGVSVEFSRSANLIVYSMGHSFIDFSQLIARLRRYGQQQTVSVYLLIAVDTIDEEIERTVRDKAGQAYEIISHFEGS